jgi:hypothetical protein
MLLLLLVPAVALLGLILGLLAGSLLLIMASLGLGIGFISGHIKWLLAVGVALGFLALFVSGIFGCCAYFFMFTLGAFLATK